MTIISYPAVIESWGALVFYYVFSSSIPFKILGKACPRIFFKIMDNERNLIASRYWTLNYDV